MIGRHVTFVSLNYAPESTGIAPYTTGLAEALTKRGHTVEVVTGFPHYPEWKRRPGASARETRGGVAVRRLEHPIPERPGISGRLWMEMAFALRCLRTPIGKPAAILVVSPSLLSAAAMVLRGRLRRLHVMVWVQDLYGLGAAETGMLGSRAGSFLQKLEGAVLRSASRVVVIHERFAAKVLELGVPTHRTTVIRNWSHVDASLDSSPRHEVRRALGWSDEDFVVLHAGNMGAKQGLENVVEAARLAQGSRFRFVLLGDGNQRAKLEHLAANLTNLSIIDPVPQEGFMPTLRAADVLLVNERGTVSDMAVPSKLTSYFAAGRPVVGAVNPNGITAQELRNSDAGVVVPADEPGCLLEAVRSLAQDENLRRRMSEAGPRYRDIKLDESVAVDAFESLFPANAAAAV